MSFGENRRAKTVAILSQKLAQLLESSNHPAVGIPTAAGVATPEQLEAMGQDHERLPAASMRTQQRRLHFRRRTRPNLRVPVVPGPVPETGDRKLMNTLEDSRMHQQAFRFQAALRPEVEGVVARVAGYAHTRKSPQGVEVGAAITGAKGAHVVGSAVAQIAKGRLYQYRLVIQREILQVLAGLVRKNRASSQLEPLRMHVKLDLVSACLDDFDQPGKVLWTGGAGE